MNKPVVVIVGSSGTVGLDLARRLSAMSADIEVVGLSREDTAEERQGILERANLAVLCLPEAAAIAFVQEAQAYPSLRILDASPAHRTHSEWVYGLPELDSNQPQRIAQAKYVANPGCYATGAILLLRPLMQALADVGIEDQPDVSITAVGGVSSGGKGMLARAQENPFGYHLYGLTQKHRHIPEITRFAKLDEEPIFMPSVVAHERGTMVQIGFTCRQLGISVADVGAVLQRAYKDSPSVAVHVGDEGARHLDGAEMACSDDVRIDVLTDAAKRRVVLVARFDNLGKGAAGAAEQNLRLMLGLV